jgi:hypothetical protein
MSAPADSPGQDVDRAPIALDAAASFPTLLVIGPRDETTHVQRALEDVPLLVEPVDDVGSALHRVGRSTFGIILLAAEDADVQDVARLHQSEIADGLPLFVVVSEACSDRRARMLYRAGATVVFAWPSEVLLVPKVIAEFVDSTAQGKPPQWSDAALAASVTARLELADGIGRGVMVRVEEGTAHVGGVVDSAWKRRRVLRILGQVPGIRSVNALDLDVTGSDDGGAELEDDTDSSEEVPRAQRNCDPSSAV